VTLITATLVLLAPSLVHYQSANESETTRHRVAHAIETIGTEAQNTRAIYVDPNRCYATCMSDGSGNRILYYMNGNALMRKQELSSSNTVNCNNGKLVVEGLNGPDTFFSIVKESLQVQTGSVGSKTGTYRATSSFIPMMREREVALFEDFECNSLAQGWKVTSGLNGTWALGGSVQGFGKYEIVHAVDGLALDTSSIEIPVDSSRFSSVLLKFYYRNDGSIVLGNSLKAEWWDGSTWQTVFSDANGIAVSVPTLVQTELTAYGLSPTTKLRFTGKLTNLNAHWYIDEIRIAVP